MTKQEFRNLTGIEPTDTEYQVIELMYVHDTREKQDFAEFFTSANLMPYVTEQAKLIERLRRSVEEGTKLAVEHDTEIAELEKNREMYKRLYYEETSKVGKIQKRLDTIRNIIEL